MHGCSREGGVRGCCRGGAWLLSGGGGGVSWQCRDEKSHSHVNSYLFRTLLYHSHNLTKQAAYYLEAPPLPPEDLEPPPEKVEEKPVEPIIEPKNTDYGRKKQAVKKRRGSNRIATGPGHSSYMVIYNAPPHANRINRHYALVRHLSQ